VKSGSIEIDPKFQFWDGSMKTVRIEDTSDDNLDKQDEQIENNKIEEQVESNLE
jgi:hypothetical protein